MDFVRLQLFTHAFRLPRFAISVQNLATTETILQEWSNLCVQPFQIAKMSHLSAICRKLTTDWLFDSLVEFFTESMWMKGFGRSL